MGELYPDFGDDTVIVTGGSSGIGRAIALEFASAGATVIVGDVREKPKQGDEPTHELIAEMGEIGKYIETDVSKVADLRTLVDSAREFGGVDVMVNNAAIATGGEFLEITPDQFDDIHQVNARGVFFGTQVTATDMIERDDPGVVVNTASISSNVAQYGQTHYDSTKGAIRMITRGTALELADYGIRVNAVAPGQIATEFAEGWAEQAHEMAENDEFIKPIPLDRVGYPEDITGAVIYLASENADYVTGELLHVDGGWQII
jgi:NAD(P)-dependent dehydrogenase (short-subunit alcohol dehydrogenase family)